MNIIHIGVSTPPPLLYRYGGAIQRRIWELASAQAEAGHKVVVYSFGEETLSRQVNNVTIHYIRCRCKSPLRHAEFQVRALQHIKQANYGSEQILHFHSQPEGAWLSRNLPGTKLLSFDYFRFRRATSGPMFHLYRRFLKSFDVLLPCSQYCLVESMKFWKLPPEKLRVLHNGVNLDQFSPNPALGAAERVRLQISKPVVLYVGRVCEQKGTNILIEAFRHLHQRIEDIQLVIAGPIGQFGVNQDNTQWLRQIRSVGGLYLGAVEEERLSGIYNLCDVFTMPTRENEMFGMAAVEAQSCGKPTVASDHGGLRETVPETCGARFRVGDAIDLATKIAQLIEDPSSYSVLAQNARRNALKFGWKTVVRDLFDIYQNKPIRLQTEDALSHRCAVGPADGIGLESHHESIND